MALWILLQADVMGMGLKLAELVGIPCALCLGFIYSVHCGWFVPQKSHKIVQKERDAMWKEILHIQEMREKERREHMEIIEQQHATLQQAMETMLKMIGLDDR